MATIISYSVKCGLCGTSSLQKLLSAYSEFGPSDLDGRPASTYRKSMRYWVAECPYCGYVSCGLNQPCKFDKTTLHKLYMEIEEYYRWPSEIAFNRKNDPQKNKTRHAASAEELTGPYFSGPLLGKSFLKYGKMLTAMGDHAGASRQYLRAAWVFDDEQDSAGAVMCRNAAIEQAQLALAEPDPAVHGRLFCMLADMLRRVGKFKRVQMLKPPFWLTKYEAGLVRYQKMLALNKDSAMHIETDIPDEMLTPYACNDLQDTSRN